MSPITFEEAAYNKGVQDAIDVLLGWLDGAQEHDSTWDGLIADMQKLIFSINKESK